MNSEEIAVSVIMITYNHEKYLRKAVDSILMQKTDYKYEIVVGDDCSTDKSQEILLDYKNKYPEIFNLVLRRKNLGATRNFYDVFKKCRGKYIAILEGDDYWTSENKLQTQIDFLEDNRDYMGTSHFVNRIDENDNRIGILPKQELVEKYGMGEINSPEDFIKYCLDDMGQIIQFQSLVFRNFLIDSNNEIKIRELITTPDFIADQQVKLLILERGKIKILDENMGNYRFIVKKGNTSFSSQKLESAYNDAIKMWNEVNKYFDFRYEKAIGKIILKENYLIGRRIINENITEGIQFILKHKTEGYRGVLLFKSLIATILKKSVKKLLGLNRGVQ